MNSSANLTIPRKTLIEAFRLLKKLCRPRPLEEAVLSYDGACLHIELGGMTVTPKAAGTWSGQVRVPGSYMMRLAKAPPIGDPLIVKIEDGRLHFGSSSINCKLQDSWSRLIELPMNATPAHILSLRFEYSPAEIEASGYAKVIAQAETWATRQIAKAAKQLAGFEVSEDVLREFVFAHLKNGYKDGFLQS